MKGKVLERFRAIRMRQEGASINEIVKDLKISKGSVSLWVRNIKLSEDQKNRLKEKIEKNANKFNDQFTRRNVFGNTYIRDKFLKIREIYQNIGRNRIKARDPDYIAGCMLFWAEGSKKRNSIQFSNSDMSMMKFFITFLRQFFQVKDSDITLEIRSYSNNGLNLDDVKKTWLKNLDINESKIKRLRVEFDYDKRSGSNTNIGKLPYGVGVLSVHKTNIVQELYGAIQEYIGFSNSKWLD